MYIYKFHACGLFRFSRRRAPMVYIYAAPWIASVRAVQQNHHLFPFSVLFIPLESHDDGRENIHERTDQHLDCARLDHVRQSHRVAFCVRNQLCASVSRSVIFLILPQSHCTPSSSPFLPRMSYCLSSSSPSPSPSSRNDGSIVSVAM